MQTQNRRSPLDLSQVLNTYRKNPLPSTSSVSTLFGEKQRMVADFGETVPSLGTLTWNTGNMCCLIKKDSSTNISSVNLRTDGHMLHRTLSKQMPSFKKNIFTSSLSNVDALVISPLIDNIDLALGARFAIQGAPQP